jgi:hypothetical protein
MNKRGCLTERRTTRARRGHRPRKRGLLIRRGRRSATHPRPSACSWWPVRLHRVAAPFATRPAVPAAARARHRGRRRRDGGHDDVVVRRRSGRGRWRVKPSGCRGRARRDAGQARSVQDRLRHCPRPLVVGRGKRATSRASLVCRGWERDAGVAFAAFVGNSAGSFTRGSRVPAAPRRGEPVRDRAKAVSPMNGRSSLNRPAEHALEAWGAVSLTSAPGTVREDYVR